MAAAETEGKEDRGECVHLWGKGTQRERERQFQMPSWAIRSVDQTSILVFALPRLTIPGHLCTNFSISRGAHLSTFFLFEAIFFSKIEDKYISSKNIETWQNKKLDNVLASNTPMAPEAVIGDSVRTPSTEKIPLSTKLRYSSWGLKL